jgi:hypothetical protein
MVTLTAKDSNNPSFTDSIGGTIQVSAGTIVGGSITMKGPNGSEKWNIAGSSASRIEFTSTYILLEAPPPWPSLTLASAGNTEYTELANLGQGVLSLYAVGAIPGSGVSVVGANIQIQEPVDPVTGDWIIARAESSQVPEPTSLIALGSLFPVLAGLVCLRRRRAKA